MKSLIATAIALETQPVALLWADEAPGGSGSVQIGALGGVW